jgi:hypothetical protein
MHSILHKIQVQKLTVTVTLQLLWDGLGEIKFIVGDDATLKIAPGATAVAPEPPMLKFKERTLLPMGLPAGTANMTDDAEAILQILA